MYPKNLQSLQLHIFQHIIVDAALVRIDRVVAAVENHSRVVGRMALATVTRSLVVSGRGEAFFERGAPVWLRWLIDHSF